jgi:hypothetical protein
MTRRHPAVRSKQARSHPTRNASARRATLALIVAPIAFTVVWVLLGEISDGYELWGARIAPYSPIAQPISGLGMGHTAVWMNTAFVCYGVAMIIGVLGFARLLPDVDSRQRRVIAAGLSLHGVGAVVVGLFNLEAIMLHLVGFLLVVSPSVTFPITARILRRLPGWERTATGLWWGAVLALIGTTSYFATFDPLAAGDNAGIGGLTQRILVLQLSAWFVWLGVTIRRSPTVTTAPMVADHVH